MCVIENVPEWKFHLSFLRFNKLIIKTDLLCTMKLLGELKREISSVNDGGEEGIVRMMLSVMKEISGVSGQA